MYHARKATSGHRVDLMCPASPGSKSRACTQRIPQEPGRPRHLHVRNRPRTGIQTPRRRDAFFEPALEEDAAWYRRPKETKRRGTGVEESERAVVPLKPGNPSHGDPVEGRASRKCGPVPTTDDETQNSMNISTKLLRIARMAKEHPKRAFTNLAHYIDLDFLREAHRLTRKDGATGVDGVTAQDYERHLEENLQDLLNRFKAGSYRAPDVRRVHIPKGPGRTRPIGIPTFEDKVLQRAVAMILGAVYEQDFMSCSYGFRPRLSAHDALSTIRQGLMDLKGGWVVEADIRNCFGAFDRRWMRKILGRRIRDGVLIRQIGKWLNAGVMEQGQRTRPKAGTPQGGVISPILANVYLHDVLDVWFERGVRPRIRGHAQLVRYADDFVVICEHESDAQRIYDALPGRLGHFGLELHPEKTRLIPFKKPPYRSDGGGNDTESWNFLGFTHYWTKSRRGYWVIMCKTMAARLNRALKAISEWCQRNRHLPIGDQHRILSTKLRGHCAYYGITGNSHALKQFRCGMAKLWRKWLMRRSGGAARKNWDWWNALERRYRLPPAHAVRSDLRRT